MSNPEDQWIEDCKNACPYCGGSGHKDDVRADITRQAPKVKALKWVECPSAIKGKPSDFRAEFYSFWWVVSENGSLTFSGDTSLRYKKFDTIEDAKAAAQADYDRRILSALED